MSQCPSHGHRLNDVSQSLSYPSHEMSLALPIRLHTKAAELAAPKPSPEDNDDAELAGRKLGILARVARRACPAGAAH